MRKRLLIGLLSAGLVGAMLPGVAAAGDGPGLFFEKVARDDDEGVYCALSANISTHWDGDYNPSLVNQLLPSGADCHPIVHAKGGLFTLD